MQPSEPTYGERIVTAHGHEDLFASWLRRDLGGLVHDFNGPASKKAPMLSGIPDSTSLVTPDLLVMFPDLGSTWWCELKHKTSAFHFRKTNEQETGIDASKWAHYLAVKQGGLSVYLCFAHEAENLVTCDEIAALDALPSKRMSPPNYDYRQTVNWPLRHLTRLATYREIFGAKAGAP